MASVMIVEDDRDTREMLGRFLELEGFEVRTAANGKLALQTLHEDVLHPCVIILDLMMPVMNGWQFREIQRTDPDLAEIPVVVVTAAGPRDDIPTTARRSLSDSIPMTWRSPSTIGRWRMPRSAIRAAASST